MRKLDDMDKDGQSDMKPRGLSTANETLISGSARWAHSLPFAAVKSRWSCESVMAVHLHARSPIYYSIIYIDRLSLIRTNRLQSEAQMTRLVYIQTVHIVNSFTAVNGLYIYVSRPTVYIYK